MRFEDVVFGGFQSPEDGRGRVRNSASWESRSSVISLRGKFKAAISHLSVNSVAKVWRMEPFHAPIRLMGTKRYLMLICLERY